MEEEWITIIEDRDLNKAKLALSNWKENHPEFVNLKDEKIRIDTIRDFEERTTYRIRIQRL